MRTPKTDLDTTPTTSRRNRVKRTLLFIALAAVIDFACHTSAHAAPGPSTSAPPQAAAVGYTVNTFHSVFDRSGVDMADTRKPGFQWYLGHFFGGKPTQLGAVTFNADGSITLNAPPDSGASINSAAPRGKSWVGVAFGGGAYFEATFKFNPEDVINVASKRAWPAWWSMSIEHLAQLPSAHWPGQAPGYDHFAELDFFEYDVWRFSPHNWYGGAVHDWFGIWSKASGYRNVCNALGGGTLFGNFQVHTPTTTDYTQYHRFGFLWVPATAEKKGYAVYYFDGKATDDRVTWTQYTDQPPTPGTAPWTFGIVDRQHVALILGTGPAQPMTVQSVNVWQASTQHNLVQ